MADIVRVLRLVQYVGPREMVEAQIRDSIHGTKRVTDRRERGGRLIEGSMFITAHTLGEFPETLPFDERAKLIWEPEGSEP